MYSKLADEFYSLTGLMHGNLRIGKEMWRVPPHAPLLSFAVL
jgi:hypothetical protein